MKLAGTMIIFLACAGMLSCGGRQSGADGDGGSDDGGDGGDRGSIFCITEDDCPDPMVCNPFSNRCTDPPPDGGSPCRADDDCPEGYWCAYGTCKEKTELPGLGEPCDMHCKDDLVCISMWGEPETCHRKCSGTEACQQDEHCVTIQGGDEGVCEADCDIYVNDCPEGMTCLQLTGGGYSCFEAGTAGVGEPCDPSATDACAPGLICETGGRKCADVCDPEGVRKVCPAGKDCIQPSGAEFGLCQ